MDMGITMRLNNDWNTARSTTGKMKSFPISGRHSNALLACHGDASGTVAIFVPFVTPSLSIYGAVST